MPYGYPDEPRIGCVVMLLTSSGTEHKLHTKKIKIWGVRVYIINGHVTSNNIDDR